MERVEEKGNICENGKIEKAQKKLARCAQNVERKREAN
jgi:hypothetical protein